MDFKNLVLESRELIRIQLIVKSRELEYPLAASILGRILVGYTEYMPYRISNCKRKNRNGYRSKCPTLGLVGQ